MTIDYRDLLIKYLRHVADVEGTDFTGKPLDYNHHMDDAEKAALRQLVPEAELLDA